MSDQNILAVPRMAEARGLLEKASKLNPGPWVKHSENAAQAAFAIGELLDSVDPEAAFSMALLHDIGRREGKTFIRHTIDGYQYLMELGYSDAARVCLTHSFPVPDVHKSSARWDCSADEADFLAQFVASTEYDIYDKLVQLCDGISGATGFCLLEKRMVDVGMRHGVNEHTVEKWQARFLVKDEIERLIGKSVYQLLPGIVDHTFGIHDTDDIEAA